MHGHLELGPPNRPRTCYALHPLMPLQPPRLPETVQTAQLQRAVQAAFGERPVIGCDG